MHRRYDEGKTGTSLNKQQIEHLQTLRSKTHVLLCASALFEEESLDFFYIWPGLDYLGLPSPGSLGFPLPVVDPLRLAPQPRVGSAEHVGCLWLEQSPVHGFVCVCVCVEAQVCSSGSFSLR